ncbi:MAG: secreted deoxyriboendonuclease [Candidatus Nomurabacteria bacterium]|nr:secreted deoxyriboendonuclease [Candidatus Nomurabacteria bacterium]
MSKKSNLIIGLIVIIIILGVVYYYKKSPKIAPTNPTPVAVEETQKTMVTLATSTPYAVVTGEYPVFSNASKDFNQKMAEAVNKAIADHIKFSEENWKARFETATPSEGVTKTPNEKDKFPIQIGTKVIRNDADVISLVIGIYEFSGGAHGGETIMTFNYNVKEQKEITLSDITSGDPTFLKKLSTRSRALLRAKLSSAAQVSPEEIDTDMLNAGTEATIANFSLFTLPATNKITFYFPEYQVAAYAFGSSELTFDLPLK